MLHLAAERVTMDPLVAAYSCSWREAIAIGRMYGLLPALLKSHKEQNAEFIGMRIWTSPKLHMSK
jgi:hypothetical protein